ncbi:MAG: hypothetical protein JEZ06_00360 [Anaerolineaceae bacterium]|nr:hypothetical protein [Anaerolineaceae bacterium]
MASERDILDMLGKLRVAFPNQKLKHPEASIALWLEFLGPYSRADLEVGINQVIRESRYYPTMYEIRASIEENLLEHGLNHFENSLLLKGKSLMTRLVRLERKFYQEKQLDTDGFLRLADDYDRDGRPGMAEHVRDRVVLFTRILENQKTEVFV